MKQLKKAISLIAVLVFLITALIPVSGLATSEDTVESITIADKDGTDVAVLAVPLNSSDQTLTATAKDGSSNPVAGAAGVWTVADATGNVISNTTDGCTLFGLSAADLAAKTITLKPATTDGPAEGATFTFTYTVTTDAATGAKVDASVIVTMIAANGQTTAGTVAFIDPTTLAVQAGVKDASNVLTAQVFTNAAGTLGVADNDKGTWKAVKADDAGQTDVIGKFGIAVARGTTPTSGTITLTPAADLEEGGYTFTYTGGGETGEYTGNKSATVTVAAAPRVSIPANTSIMGWANTAITSTKIGTLDSLPAGTTSAGITLTAYASDDGEHNTAITYITLTAGTVEDGSADISVTVTDRTKVAALLGKSYVVVPTINNVTFAASTTNTFGLVAGPTVTAAPSPMNLFVPATGQAPASDLTLTATGTVYGGTVASQDATKVTVASPAEAAWSANKLTVPVTPVAPGGTTLTVSGVKATNSTGTALPAGAFPASINVHVYQLNPPGSPVSIAANQTNSAAITPTWADADPTSAIVKAYRWTKKEGSAGNLTGENNELSLASGRFTMPATGNATLVCTAYSDEGATQALTSVEIPISQALAIVPSGAQQLAIGAEKSFEAQIGGVAPGTGNWTLKKDGAGDDLISSWLSGAATATGTSVKITPPETAVVDGSYTLTYTTAEPVASANVTITVLAAGTPAITPTTMTLGPGVPGQFTATIGDTASTGGNWSVTGPDPATTEATGWTISDADENGTVTVTPPTSGVTAAETYKLNYTVGTGGSAKSATPAVITIGATPALTTTVPASGVALYPNTPITNQAIGSAANLPAGATIALVAGTDADPLPSGVTVTNDGGTLKLTVPNNLSEAQVASLVKGPYEIRATVLGQTVATAALKFAQGELAGSLAWATGSTGSTLDMLLGGTPNPSLALRWGSSEPVSSSGDISYAWSIPANSVATTSASSTTAPGTGVTITPVKVGTTTLTVTANPDGQDAYWTKPPATQPATVEKTINVYQFGLENEATTLLSGVDGAAQVTPKWTNDSVPSNMTITVAKAADQPADAPTPVKDATTGAWTIPVSAGTSYTASSYAYTVTAKLGTDGMSATKTFTLNISSSLSITDTTPDAGGSSIVSSPVTKPDGTVAYEVNVDNQQYTDQGATELVVTQYANANYAWSIEPADPGTPNTEEYSGTGANVLPLPQNVGVYTVNLTVSAGTHTENIEYTVVMEGDLGGSVTDGGAFSALRRIPVAEGATIPLYPSWNEAGQPDNLGAPAGTQNVQYDWTVTTPANGTIRPSDGNNGVKATAQPSVSYTALKEQPNAIQIRAYVTIPTAGRATPGTYEVGRGTILIGSTGFEFPTTSQTTPIGTPAMEWAQQIALGIDAGDLTGSPNGQLPLIAEDPIGTDSSLWNSALWNTITVTGSVNDLTAALGGPSGSTSNNSMYLDVNRRFELRVPSEMWGGVSASDLSFQWEYRTSANAGGGNGLEIPSGMGFYGMNSTWLRSGPITRAMDGWQFRLVAKYATGTPGSGDETIETQYSPWIGLRVKNDDMTAIVPQVVLSSSPMDAAGIVPVTQTGDVTFTANIKNNIEPTQLSYRWQSRAAATADAPNPQWSDMEGQTQSTLTLTNVQADQNGVSYRCIVTNNGAQTGINGESTILTLQVNSQAGAVIISKPAAASLLNLFAGRTATFSAEGRTDNGQEVTYQWFRKGAPGPVTYGGIIDNPTKAAQELANAPTTLIAGATSPEYTTPALEEGIYEYVCRVTNAQNKAQTLDSPGFYLVVTRESRRPDITSPKTAQNIGTPAGQSVTFEVEATVQSQEPLTYQWQARENASSNWADLQNQKSAKFVLPNPSGSDSGWQYQCIVTNPAAELSTTSPIYTLTVWATADTPVVRAITPTTVEGALGSTVTGQVVLKSTASTPSQVTGAPGLTAQWYLNDAPVSYAALGIAAPAITEDPAGTYTSMLTIPLAANNALSSAKAVARAINGVWSCRWTNASPTMANYVIAPYANSGMCNVQITVPGDPSISVQPKNLTSAVGTTAKFQVGARLNADPEASPRGDLVYIWQRSSNGGNTWANCLSTDGSGQFTSTFSVPITQAMYDYATAANVQNFKNPYTYRVIVANSAYGPRVISDVVALTITPGTEVTPAINVKDGVELTISDKGDLGKVLSGTALTVTKAGHKASEVLDMLTIAPANEAYRLRVVNATGTALTADDVVGTGCKVELIDTANGDKVLDTVIIIVRGDVMGSGVISLTQLVRMAAAFKDPTQLEGAYLLAGDMDGSGAINLTDLVQEAAIYRAEILDAGATPTPSPTAAPTTEPTAEPTTAPTTDPTTTPTTEPTAEPTTAPTTEPSTAPTTEPTAEPTAQPTAEPTVTPTAA